MDENKDMQGNVNDKDVDSISIIDKANAAAERIEKANERLEANLKRQEEMQVKNALAGKTDASIPPAEESDEDYAKSVVANDVKSKSS